MASEEQKRGILAAEEYAKFFLKHPLISAAYVFGSVALREDGHDVDMAFELKNKDIGFLFLARLHQYIQLTLKQAERDNLPATDDYNAISRMRGHLAFSLLGWEDIPAVQDQIWNITWGGKYKQWDQFFKQGRVDLAEQLERMYLRPLDIFLMPPRWKESDKVKRLLPNWVSRRAWAKRSFYDILVLQARKFNPATAHFEKRKRGSRQAEKHLQYALQLEATRPPREKRKGT